MGGASIDEAGVPLTEATLAAAKASDAVLMGSIGGDAKTSPWYQLEPSSVRRQVFAVEKGSELIRKPKTGSSL